MKALKNRQRGFSFSGFIMIAFLLVFVALLGMKLIPAYVHNAQIASIFKAIATDSAMQGASIKDIKEAYNKRASINTITDLSAEDIDISKNGGSLTLSATYSVKIPLVGNITLLLDFNPSSS